VSCAAQPTSYPADKPEKGVAKYPSATRCHSNGQAASDSEPSEESSLLISRPPEIPASSSPRCRSTYLLVDHPPPVSAFISVHQRLKKSSTRCSSPNLAFLSNRASITSASRDRFPQKRRADRKTRYHPQGPPPTPLRQPPDTSPRISVYQRSSAFEKKSAHLARKPPRHP